MIEVAIFTVFGLMLGALVWWSWRERERMQRQQVLDADLARLGRDVQKIAHDVGNLLSAVLPTVRFAREASPEELPVLLDRIERAADSTRRLMETVHGTPGTGGEPRSTEAIARLVVSLFRNPSTPIRVRVGQDLAYRGEDIDALRVVQNLVVNAVREASRIDDGAVNVVLEAGALCVSNPVTNAADALRGLREAEGKVPGAQGGYGLGIAREAAARLGWTIRYELAEHAITFRVEGTTEPPPSGRRAT